MSLELTQPTGAGSGGSPAAGRAQARAARQGRLAWWLAQARAQPLAAVGAAIVLGWVLVAIVAPVIAPYSYKHGDYLIAAPSLQKAATEGAFGTRAEQLVKGFTGRPRAAVLSGIALFHPAAHLGEAVTVRSAGGFGTGV